MAVHPPKNAVTAIADRPPRPAAEQEHAGNRERERDGQEGRSRKPMGSIFLLRVALRVRSLVVGAGQSDAVSAARKRR